MLPQGVKYIGITRKRTKKTVNLECRSEVKARNTGSHELVVEFSSSPDNLSYFSDCPTSYLNLHLVINVAAQNYNLSHWTVLFSYHNSPAWKIFKRVREKNSFEKLALNYQSGSGGHFPPKRKCTEEVDPAKFCISVWCRYLSLTVKRRQNIGLNPACLTKMLGRLLCGM